MHQWDMRHAVSAGVPPRVRVPETTLPGDGRRCAGWAREPRSRSTSPSPSRRTMPCAPVGHHASAACCMVSGACVAHGAALVWRLCQPVRARAGLSILPLVHAFTERNPSTARTAPPQAGPRQEPPRGHGAVRPPSSPPATSPAQWLGASTHVPPARARAPVASRVLRRCTRWPCLSSFHSPCDQTRRTSAVSVSWLGTWVEEWRGTSARTNQVELTPPRPTTSGQFECPRTCRVVVRCTWARVCVCMCAWICGVVSGPPGCLESDPPPRSQSSPPHRSRTPPSAVLLPDASNCRDHLANA